MKQLTVKRLPAMPKADDFLEFLQREGCRPSTAKVYLRLGNRIHRSKLDPKDWLEANIQRPDERSGERGTAKKTVGVYRSAVSYYILWRSPDCGKTRQEISASLLSSRPFRSGTKREAATADAVAALAQEAVCDEPVYTILHLLEATGARIAEVCGLLLADIDWENKKLLLHGKGGRERTVIVSDALLTQLRLYIDHTRTPHTPPGDHLFYGKRWQTPIWTTGLNRDLRKYKKPGEAGYFTPHQIRHLVATEMVNDGAKLPMVRDVLGHQDIQTLNPYLHASEEEQRKVMERKEKKSLLRG